MCCERRTISEPLPWGWCRAVLARYYIGDLAAGREVSGKSLALEDELADGTFYAVLKKRVAAYFRANKVAGGGCVAVAQHTCLADRVWCGAVASSSLLTSANSPVLQLNPRTSTALYIKAGLILATLALSYYATFFASSSVLVHSRYPQRCGPAVSVIVFGRGRSTLDGTAPVPWTHTGDAHQRSNSRGVHGGGGRVHPARRQPRRLQHQHLGRRPPGEDAEGWGLGTSSLVLPN
jgi:hypothetical protein